MNVSFNHSLTQELALQDSRINKGTIYFTTDTNSIVHDGKIYGVSSEDKSAIAAILSAITNTDGQLGVNMLPYVLQSESEYSSDNNLHSSVVHLKYWSIFTSFLNSTGSISFNKFNSSEV